VSSFEIAVVAVFSFLVFLRFIVLLGLSAAIVRPVRRCPACFDETVAFRPRWHRFLPSAFEWRWCPRCRWEGPARKVPATVGVSGDGRPASIEGSGDVPERTR
jgi:hypothetical protein